MVNLPNGADKYQEMIKVADKEGCCVGIPAVTLALTLSLLATGPPPLQHRFPCYSGFLRGVRAQRTLIFEGVSMVLLLPELAMHTTVLGKQH